MRKAILFFVISASCFTGNCLAQTKAKPAAAPAKETVSIDVVSTYERVMDKGYKSAEMLRKAGDRHFFNGDLTSAAKWYTELFNITTDLDAIYYYRYGQ